MPGSNAVLISGRNSAVSIGERDDSKSPSAFRSPRASTLPKVPDKVSVIDRSKSQFPSLKTPAAPLGHQVSMPQRKLTVANASLTKREALANSSVHDTFEREISRRATAYLVHDEVD